MISSSTEKKRLILMAALALSALIIPASSLFAKHFGNSPETSHHIVIFRFQRQTFQQDATPEEEKTVRTHLQYLKDLHAKGKIVYAGFRKDAVDGIVIFETASRDEAKSLVENDPAVKTRLFAWELHGFQTVLIRTETP
ncbi:MAG: YciI family protein [Pyrinomonadaceae bacterium]